MSNRVRSSSTEVLAGPKPTLGLVGITINAMALIAPGAFLWTTYQIQSPRASAANMWAAIALSTIIALLTASCYATLSRAYPEAGAGSSYYYAEAAINSQGRAYALPLCSYGQICGRLGPLQWYYDKLPQKEDADWGTDFTCCFCSLRLY